MPKLRPDLREYLGNGGILYDNVEDIAEIVAKPVPEATREEGFELARRSDINVHKQQLLDLWKHAGDFNTSGARLGLASVEKIDWGPVGVNWNWVENTYAIVRELTNAVGASRPFLIVDEGQLATDLPKTLRATSFPSEGGQYLGPPIDSAAGIELLERSREHGATAIAFVASSFWWLEHYRELAQHLRAHYRCVLDNERALVFDLAHSSK